jgi:hypothetical protein
VPSENPTFYEFIKFNPLIPIAKIFLLKLSGPLLHTTIVKNEFPVSGFWVGGVKPICIKQALCEYYRIDEGQLS